MRLLSPLIALAIFSLLSTEMQAQEKDRYHAILSPRHETTLSAEVASTIISISKKMGETFDEGEILIKLDDTIFRGRKEEAESRALSAQTEVDAKKQLFQDGATTLLDLKEAEAKLAAARADLIIADKHLQACSIVAPYAGKVVDVKFEEHELVQPADKLIEIVDDQVLMAKFLIPSVHLAHIAIGDTIKLTIKETGATVDAIVKRISAVIDPASATAKIEAEVDNGDFALKSGMTATATD